MPVWPLNSRLGVLRAMHVTLNSLQRNSCWFCLCCIPTSKLSRPASAKIHTTVSALQYYPKPDSPLRSLSLCPCRRLLEAAGKRAIWQPLASNIQRRKHMGFKSGRKAPPLSTVLPAAAISSPEACCTPASKTLTLIELPRVHGWPSGWLPKQIHFLTLSRVLQHSSNAKRCTRGLQEHKRRAALVIWDATPRGITSAGDG